MRRLLCLWIAFAMSATACATSQPSEPAVAEPSGDGEEAADPGQQDPAFGTQRRDDALPAGLYGQWPYESAVCEYCEAPRHALLWAVHADPEAARADVENLTQKDLDLQPGYPLVVHTDELGITPDGYDGIAVVLGLFATRDDAEASRDDLGLGAQRLSVIDVPGLDEMRDFRGEHDIKRVARVHRDATAWRVTDVERLMQDKPGIAYAPSPKLLTIEPADCEVSTGRLIVTPQFVDKWGYRFVETTCDDEPVVIRVADTLLRAVVIYELSEKQWVSKQVLGVECDQPVVGQRAWPDGEDTAVLLGLCGDE